MLEIQLRKIEQLLTILDSVDAQYKIILADGTCYGDLMIQEEIKRRPLVHPYGAVTKYVEPYLLPMNVGDALEIPANGYGLERVRSVACSCASRRWGNGSLTTYTNLDTDNVEILRLK
jgi:hypothetical protein